MTDFEKVLDDSLEQIASGAATIDECLARYPEYSEQLGPLLRTGSDFSRAREIFPSKAYKARARGKLLEEIQAHPRGKKTKFSIFWTAAISLAVLVIAFFITGTAFAQGALPNQPLYEWKLSSEQFWRASSSDRVGVDLALADRRTSEIMSEAADQTSQAKAMNGYKEILVRLNSNNDAKNNDRILLTLKSNQKKLSAAGIKIPELDKRLSP